MKFVKDLILARDKANGKRATMHIYTDGVNHYVINDILGGNIVFTGSFEKCEDWFFNSMLPSVKVG